MGRIPCCDKEGLKKGPWTPEEDKKLLDYVQKHGPGRWRTLPKNAGLNRCGKSCRLRWTNYLKPDIKRGRFTPEEEEAIIQLHSVMGNKWSAIAARLPGRTDNEIKNYWNTTIRTHAPRLDLLKLSSLLSSSHQLNLQNLLGPASWLDPNLLNLANAFLSTQLRNPEPGLQNLQENQQGYDTQFLQNQIQSCTTSSAQLLDIHAAQPAETTKMEPFGVDENYMSSQNSLSNFWQNNEVIPALTDCSSYKNSDPSMMNNLAEDLNFLSGNQDDNIPNMSFSSLLSTPASSLTGLNSSSVADPVSGCSNEEERDSYCSNVLLLDVQNGLNSHGIM